MEYKLNADYHTHTTFSDGKSSIQENVEQAIKIGLKTIGIADHGFNHRLAGIKSEDIPVMRQEVERLQKLYPQIKILLGVEANLLNLNGDLDVNEEDLKNFDYILCGIHYFTYGKKVKGSFKFNFKNLFKPSKKYIEKITDSYIKAMEKYPIKVIVHPNYVVPVNIKRLAKAAYEKGIFIEFNGKRTEFNEQQTQELIDSKVQFIIGSDAHSAERIGEFSIPLNYIKKNNIPLERIVNLEEKND